MNGIKFSKEFWPKSGSMIGHDINDLWDTHPEQAEVFIAEALINNVPSVHINLNEYEEAVVEVFLWSVGGDCLTTIESLDNLIVASAKDYSEIYSEEQADDVREKLVALNKLTDSILEAKSNLNNLVSQWEEKTA